MDRPVFSFGERSSMSQICQVVCQTQAISILLTWFFSSHVSPTVRYLWILFKNLYVMTSDITSFDMLLFITGSPGCISRNDKSGDWSNVYV